MDSSGLSSIMKGIGGVLWAMTLFSVVLPASGLISLQQNIIESNKINFMMKYHFEFLPTKV